MAMMPHEIPPQRASPLATAVVSFEAYEAPADAQVAGFSTADVIMDEEDPHEYILHLAQSPSSGAIAAALSNRSIALYGICSPSASPGPSAPTLQPRGSLVGHSGVITDLETFDSGGAGGAMPHALLSSSEDRTVRCWDVHAGREAFQLAHDAAVLSVSVGCGGTLLAAASGCAAHFWDVRQQRRRVGRYADGHTGGEDDLTQVVFNPMNPAEVATAGEDGLVCVYDTRRASGDEALLGVLNANCAVRRVGFFAPGGEGLYCLTGSETLSLWHKSTAQCLVDWQDIRERIGAAIAPSPSAAAAARAPPSVNYLIDCHYEGSSERLFVAAGDWGGAVTVCEVSDSAVTPTRSLGGGGEAGGGGVGHSAMVRSFLAAGTSGQHTGAFLLTGGEDARICAWDGEAASAAVGPGAALGGVLPSAAAPVPSSSSPSRGGLKKQGGGGGGGGREGKGSGRGGVVRPY